jgi:hypothetical protein
MGLIAWLATSGGSKPYRNPVGAGRLALTASCGKANVLDYCEQDGEEDGERKGREVGDGLCVDVGGRRELDVRGVELWGEGGVRIVREDGWRVEGRDETTGEWREIEGDYWGEGEWGVERCEVCRYIRFIKRHAGKGKDRAIVRFELYGVLCTKRVN